MKKAIVFLFFLVVALKWIAAASLNLFSDEAFYWQCAQRLDLAYTDLPPLTAFLVWLGAWVAGDSVLGVRLLFGLIGMAFPWTVWLLAKPLVGEADAWLAAGLALIIPGLAYLGVVAIPDVAILELSALFLLFFERATRESPPGEASGGWLWAGLVAALGFATHYRFVLAPLSALLYLMLTRRGRHFWQGKGPWMMGLLMAPGLLPVLIYNWKNDFAPLAYFLGVRHEPGFQTEALVQHLAEQAMLITPLLYIGLLAALFGLVVRAKQGEDRALLCAMFALVPLFLYWAAAPLHDSGPHTLHWPLPGYLPLLIFLPATLRRFVKRGRRARRLALVWLALGFALFAWLALLVELITGALGMGSLREPFLGWKEAAQRTERHLAGLQGSSLEPPLIVADNYKLGSHLEFRLHEKAEVLILDHSKNYEHGRQLQYAFWDRGEEAVWRNHGREVLLVVQMSEMPAGHEDRWMRHVEEFFRELEILEDFEIPLGSDDEVMRLRFYRGTLAEKNWYFQEQGM